MVEIGEAGGAKSTRRDQIATGGWKKGNDAGEGGGGEKREMTRRGEG
jgi:hypothetical protein